MRAKYASSSFKLHSSFVLVRNTGSMDTPLWHDLNRHIYLPCYEGKFSKEPVRDPTTLKLITGPLIVKTDAGPGRLCDKDERVDFCSEMAEKGVHILLSLPNGTACTAEMDQLFEKFKPRCHKSIQRVAGMKMAARVLARRKGLTSEKNDDEIVDDDDSKKRGNSFCNVSIGNRDLANIVNGYPGDAIELRPFDYCFQKDMIIDTWKAVGFIPMTANAVNDPKVRYQLGEGGAPDREKDQLDSLVNDYRKQGEDLSMLGFNGELLDLEPVPVETQVLPENDEAAITEILANGCINKAGSLFQAGISIANCSIVLEALKRKKLQENALREKKVTEKKSSNDVTQWLGLVEFAKWYSAGQKVDGNGSPILSKKAAVAIVKVLLPRIAPEAKLKNYVTLKSCTTWLGELASGTTWVTEMQAIEDAYENEELPLRRLF